jgi:hypothetical protein
MLEHPNKPRQGADVRPLIPFTILLSVGLAPASTQAGPSAEVAKRCVHYSYLAFPYKRPGSVRMSGDRQTYFKDCMANEGKVPEPVPPKS